MHGQDWAITQEQKIFINNIDVTEKIRSPQVTSMVSEIAKQQYVRDLLTKQQQVIGEDGGLVAEGRDIGTAVFPNADVKIFLTASPTERAKRRALDFKKRGYEFSSIEDLEKEIKARDKKDKGSEVNRLKDIATSELDEFNIKNYRAGGAEYDRDDKRSSPGGGLGFFVRGG